MAETLLTRPHHGQTIVVDVGAWLLVCLDESPTTGYTWTPLSAGEALPLAAADFKPAAAGSVGGGGQRCLRFNVLEPGRHRLELALMRPWEGAGTAVDSFMVTVQAQPP